MRRIAAIITAAGVIALVAPIPSATAAWTPAGHLHLDIVGQQPMFRQETSGTGLMVYRSPAGFIGAPGNSPQRFGDPPSTSWIKRIENKDLETHHLWQCSGNFHRPTCTFSSAPVFKFLLQPRAVVALPPGAIPKQNIPIYFSCTIHPWMRGVIRYDGGA